MDKNTKRSSIISLKYLPWVMCGIGALFYCYEYFLRVTPSVMQQELIQTFNIDNMMFGFLSAFYYYAYTPLQIPVGVLMDRFGPRRLITFACLICVVGTCLFAANIFSIAAIGRFLVGFGSAFAFVGVVKLASIWLPPSRFAMVCGLVTALGMLGPVLGDILLTPMVNSIGWHQTVFITAVLGVILAVIIWFSIRDTNPAHQYQNSDEAHQAATFKDLFKGLAYMLRTRQVWLAGIIACFLFLPITVFAELWGIPYLEQAQHFPELHASIVNPLLFVGFALGGILLGWLSDNIQRRKIVIITGSALAFIVSCILFYVPGLTVIQICVLLFLLGLFSGVEVITFAVSRESVANRFAGTAIAMTNFLTMLGGMIFQPLIGRLLDWHSGNIMHLSGVVLTNSDYRFALSIVPISLALAAILGLFMHETGAGMRSLSKQ